MNKRDYDSMKKQIGSIRDDAVATAEQAYQNGMNALDQLWQLTQNGDSGSTGRRAGSTASTGTTAAPRKKTTRKKTAAAKTTRKRGGRRRRGALIESMRTAIESLSGQFTIGDVKSNLSDSLVRNTNPAVFSTTMKRLEDLGEIQVVSRGRGRRASVYKKKG